MLGAIVPSGAELCLRLLAYGTCAFTLLFSLVSVAAARRFRLRRPEPLDPAFLPPVTILKPIKGSDRDMRRNLASFLSQNYPEFQVLFCLQNPEDPALAVLKRLREEFPRADMEIIVSKNRVGYNPKVNNLSNAYAFAKHDCLLISDSDIFVSPDFLRRTVAPLRDPGVGMVTCFYRAPRTYGFGGALEAISVNAQFLPQSLVAAYLLNLRFAMGAAMLVRRPIFEACGGFAALGQHLADDFILGSFVTAAGYRLEFSDVVVDSIPGSFSLTENLAHLARWARTIRTCQPWGYSGLFLLQGFGFLTLYMLLFGAGRAALALWLATAAARMATVGWMHLAYLSNPGILIQLPLIPLGDLVQSAIWVAGFRSKTVRWRGQSYHVMVGGRLVPEKQEAPAATAATLV